MLKTALFSYMLFETRIVEYQVKQRHSTIHVIQNNRVCPKEDQLLRVLVTNQEKRYIVL